MSDWFNDPNMPSPENHEEPQNDPTEQGGSAPVENPAPAENPTPAPTTEQPFQSPVGGQSFPNGYSGGYDPYGWQRMASNQSFPQSPYQPPKKKKSGTAILIALLASVCVLTIGTLSVLLVLTLNNQLPLSGDPSSGEFSQTVSSTDEVVSQSDRDVNENAPSLDIKGENEEEDALSTREIVQKNLDSTVVLTMYEKVQSYPGSEATYQEVGGASGIVMTADGYIITNRHCVINENTTNERTYARISVTLYDGTVYENAEVIGADRYTDLAVIKVDATDLKPATFGDSSKTYLGDRVVAIGNAGGLQWTVTQGILSGLSREIYNNTDYAIKCIQVDAAINPGNSGGPLFNTSGQVIAINSAKLSPEYGYEGLGFAIPINEAKPIIDDLLKYGYVKGRVMLSITGQAFNEAGYDAGFQILSINADSVFANTQVKAGDIITYIGDVRVKDADALSSALSKHKVGETIKITLNRIDRYRQETSFTVTVTLIENRG